MPPLTVEEWKNLSDEEKQSRANEKPEGVEQSQNPPPTSEVKEDVVIIDGKPRPLKNFVGEISRKIREDVVNEFRNNPQQPQPSHMEREVPTNNDLNRSLSELSSLAEKEIEETGRLIPIQTITNLIAQGTQYHIRNYNQVTKKAAQTIKKVKKDLKDQYKKDFADYENDFDEEMEKYTPDQVSEELVKTIFHAVRGKKIDVEELVKREREKATEKANEDKKIIGDPSSPTEASNSTKETKLTQEQSDQMAKMGFLTESDYLGRLQKYRQIAKNKGSKKVPDLLFEPLQL